MTPATAAAVSLLERLRTLAKDQAQIWKPFLMDLVQDRFERGDPWWDAPGMTEAQRALSHSGYYKTIARDDWISRIDAAIAALKGEMT